MENVPNAMALFSVIMLIFTFIVLRKRFYLSLRAICIAISALTAISYFAFSTSKLIVLYILLWTFSVLIQVYKLDKRTN